MSFADYLASKKIDAARFQVAEPEVFNEWADLFEQVHPNSFTLQKLNLINAIRRRYWLGPEAALDKSSPTSAPPAQPTAGKPKIK